MENKIEFKFVVDGLSHEQANELMLIFISMTEDRNGNVIEAEWVEEEVGNEILT